LYTAAFLDYFNWPFACSCFRLCLFSQEVYQTFQDCCIGNGYPSMHQTTTGWPHTWNTQGFLWTWKTHGILREFCATSGKTDFVLWVQPVSSSPYATKCIWCTKTDNFSNMGRQAVVSYMSSNWCGMTLIYEGHYYVYFLLQQPLEKYHYGSEKAWKTRGIFLLLCGHHVQLKATFCGLLIDTLYKHKIKVITWSWYFNVM